MKSKHSIEEFPRTAIARLVAFTLSELLSEQGDPQPARLDEETCLIGPSAVLSSLGLVSLIVELEQSLEEEHGIMVTLADERAMSRKRSPFRTVGSLADYICQLIAQG